MRTPELFVNVYQSKIILAAEDPRSVKTAAATSTIEALKELAARDMTRYQTVVLGPDMKVKPVMVNVEKAPLRARLITSRPIRVNTNKEIEIQEHLASKTPGWLRLRVIWDGSLPKVFDSKGTAVRCELG